MKMVANQLGLAVINNESFLIHILLIQPDKITARLYNSTTGRWLSKRKIEASDIKYVFYHVGGKPQKLLPPKATTKVAA